MIDLLFRSRYTFELRGWASQTQSSGRPLPKEFAMTNGMKPARRKWRNLRVIQKILLGAGGNIRIGAVNRKRIVRLNAAAVLACLTMGILPAQNPTATLVGTVRDISGAVVTGAALEVRNTDTGNTRKATSDEK